jgi:hypothetical protein
LVDFLQIYVFFLLIGGGVGILKLLLSIISLLLSNKNTSNATKSVITNNP